MGVALAAGFFVLGRAEALLFLALRPWLLLLAASLVARYQVRDRVLFYVLALLLAACAETALLLGLDASNPWPEMLRGLAGGAVLAVVADLALQVGSRLSGRWGRPLVTAALAVFFLTPVGLSGYHALLADEGKPGEAAARPDLMLMTALPIIWGEKGAFDPSSRPAAAYVALQREFTVRPLDVLDDASLRGGRLLLLAQPRVLAPEELVALDDWVRGGGRALILSDPALLWPSELPLGDPRRPPPVGLLAPILDHWGLRIDGPAKRSLVMKHRGQGQATRRLIMAAPGTIDATNPLCRVEWDRYLARCPIGSGSVILLAEADLLQDGLWAAAGEGGEKRHRRISDNPLFVMDLLDQLVAETSRSRVDVQIDWIGEDAPRAKAMLLAALPLLLAFALAGLVRLRRKG